MNRLEWLKSLKVNDLVVCKCYADGEPYYNIYKIKNITKTGRIRLNNDILLNENGFFREKGVWNHARYEIEELTEEVKMTIQNNKLKIKLRNQIREKLDILQKLKIKDVDKLNEFDNQLMYLIVEFKKEGD